MSTSVPGGGEPALSAELASFAPQEVFAWLERTGKSGLASFTHGEHVKCVWLHRGEVVTRTALYEHLFDESDDTLSNLLDVHVFSIRKKLGSDLIKTRRGQGYCIET